MGFLIQNKEKIMKWFKHDTNANRDARIIKLIMKYGANGYALYFYCLELIANKIDKNNISFTLEHDAELLGDIFKIDTEKTQEIMDSMVELGLFEKNENGNLVCLKLANRLDDTTSKNPEIRHIVAKAREYGKIKSPIEYVYIFQDGNKYKIGKSKNVNRRFADAKNLNTNISLYYFFETVDSYLMESKLHNYFNNKKIKGEWFSLDKNDLKFIMDIKTIDDVPKCSVDTPNGSEQNRIDKNRIDKNRIDKNIFKKPTTNEIDDYLKEKNITSFTGEKFYNYYESKDWMIGKNKMKSWKAAVNTWVINNKENQGNNVLDKIFGDNNE